LHILLLEDVPTDAELTTHVLKQAGIKTSITVIDNKSDFVRELSESPPDVILSDFTMPGFSGDEALQIARTTMPEIPFIFVTGTLGDERAVELVKAGAWDYVTKVNLARLVPAIERSLKIVADNRHRNELRLQVEASSMALQKRDARYRALVQNSTDVVLMIDEMAAISYSSPAIKNVLGIEPDEAEGTSILDLVHADDLDSAAVMLQEILLLAGSHTAGDFRLRRSDGTYAVVETVVTNLLDEESVRAVVMNIRDVTDERALMTQLSHQALHDSLTGLPNRALLLDRLAVAHERDARNGGRSALFLLDLDDFKGVNDTFGHQVGDQLLISLAHRLVEVTRSPDTLSRFGGDEFVYLAEGIADEIAIEKIVERLLGVFAEPFLITGISIDQSASIGVALSDTARSRDYEHLLQNADTALYQTKGPGQGPGQGQHVLFTATMSELSSTRFTLTQDLGRALTRNELAMHYQPIVDLGTGEVAGYEALMRWSHPERGSIPPDVFIPLAEQSDLVTKLGFFALGEATAEAASWERVVSGLTAPYVAVNLSARQFYDANLLSDIEEALASNELAPGRLVLEITESVALFDIDSAIKVIERLRRLNVRLALDDFGTGYSSLSYLMRLNPETIKIDRSFVSSVHSNTSSERLLEAIVQLSHRLGVIALAEGIETREQLALLSNLGCEFGQGYLFSPAVPAQEVPAMPDLVLRNWTGQAITS
jgi:diguanylate cyclase (GGDEF)-like protein/PAS domain S-box-containing protein